MSFDAQTQIHNFLVTGLAKWGLPGRNKNSTVSKAAARTHFPLSNRNRMSNPHIRKGCSVASHIYGYVARLAASSKVNLSNLRATCLEWAPYLAMTIPKRQFTVCPRKSHFPHISVRIGDADLFHAELLPPLPFSLKSGHIFHSLSSRSWNRKEEGCVTVVEQRFHIEWYWVDVW